jgi:hypothetical protein
MVSPSAFRDSLSGAPVPGHNQGMAVLLERECAFYSAHEAEWATVHPGRFVVVKGDRLLGAFDSMEEALAAGAASFGLDSFLVRRLGLKQDEVNIPALTLGLLRADSQHPVV